jgi:hypothetical protein
MSGMPVTVLTVLTALCCGLLLGLLGNLKLALSRRPEHVGQRVRWWLGALNVLLVPLLLGSGLLADAWGPRPVLIAGSVVLTLAFLALTAGPAFRRGVAATLAAAAGGSALLVALIVLLPHGLFGPRESVASLQLGLALVALGGLVGMLLFDVLHRLIGFRRAMAVVALIVLLPGLLAALPGAVPERGSVQGGVNFVKLFSEPGVWAAALVMFFYAPLEAFVSVWAATYLEHVGQAQRQGNWLAGFWFMVLLSRAMVAIIMHFATGYRADWISFPPWLLVTNAVLVAAILGNMSGMLGWRSALSLLLMLGFFLGPLFPGLVGMVLRSEGGRGWPATAFAALHVGGSVGSLALAPLVRYCARTRISVGLRIPMVLAMVMALTMLLFAVMQ